MTIEEDIQTLLEITERMENRVERNIPLWVGFRIADAVGKLTSANLVLKGLKQRDLV